MPLSGGVKPGTIFGRRRPLNIWESKKNVQNSPQFRTTFDFDNKSLWKGWRCQQAVNGVIKHFPCCVEQKKIVNFCPLTKKLCWHTQNQQCARFQTTLDFIAHVSGTNRDIEKTKMAFSTMIVSQSVALGLRPWATFYERLAKNFQWWSMTPVTICTYEIKATISSKKYENNRETIVYILP